MTDKKKHKSGGFLTQLGTIGELLRFMWARKLWWMIPMILVLVLFAADF